MIFLLFYSAYSQLVPKTAVPILLSRNNAGSYASYTFYFQITNYVPAESLLEITFPSIVYSSGLSMTTCSALNYDQTIIPCSVDSYTVSLRMGELSNADANNTYNVTILDVLNPDTKGTSLFRLQFRKGVNVIDYCDFFADVGIVPQLSDILTASVSCLSDCIAGDVSSYELVYETTVDYEPGSRIFVNFPSTLKFTSSFNCTSDTFPSLECSITNQQISFSATTSSLSSGSTITVEFSSIQNPSISGSIGDFSITVFGPKVNTVLEEIKSISGPELSPNSITSIIACPGGPSSSCIGYYPYTSLLNTQPYTLSITTTNGVPLGGQIKIWFLSDFTLRSNYCLVTSGLKNQGYTEDDQILCTINEDLITITRFKDFSGGSITIKVIATNPGVADTYSAFKVTTYNKDDIEIDTGNLGYITVANIPHPQKWEVDFNKALIVNSKVQMTVIFQPYTSGLYSNEVSFNMHFPNTFAFTGTVVGYLTPHDVFPELAVTPTISGSSIAIPSSTESDSYTNSLNYDNRVRVAGSTTSDGILLPSLPGTYFIEMITAYNGDDIEAILCEVKVLPDVMSGSVKAFSYDVNKESLYEIVFTPTITIPQGKVPELPQFSWGTFDIWFSTQNSNLQDQWTQTLIDGGKDLDIVPCKAIKNIQPVDGDNLTCRLITTDSTSPNTYATVRVTNFGIIYKNVPVTLHLANITNPSTPEISISLTVVTYSITQRQYQEYNKVNFTFPRYFYLNSNPSLPKINGRSPSPYGDGLNEVKFTPNTVGLHSLVSFILWTESDISSGGHFYLKFPETYPLLQSSIECFINYATALDCYTYPDSRWISILNLDYSMSNHVEYTFTIKYLKNPAHREEPAGASIVAISEGVEIEYIYFSNFDYLDLGNVYPVNVYPSSYKANNVDTVYYWIFTLTNDLGLNSQIILSFPKKDFVLDTVPAPLCAISTALEPVDELVGILCNISGTSIVVSGFQEYTGGNEITVEVYNILNPPTSRFTDYFEIESYDESGKLVDGNYAIDKIFIQSEENVGVFEYVDFYANPSNGFATADYLISILPSRSLPDGSVITLIFPQNEYSDIPEALSCSLSGGLTTLDECYGDGINVITVVTDSEYSKDSLSLPINITIYSLSNFGPRLTSGLLEVEISSTGVIIDSSPDSQNNRKITMGDQPGDMSLKSLSLSPQTAGEKAVYNFTFQISTSFNNSCQIIIQFPSTYSRDLSEKVFCYSPQISKRSDLSVKCSVSGKNLKIYDTINVNVNKITEFVILVEHVRNPSESVNDNFIFYTQCGYEMMDYGKSEFVQSFTEVPQVAYLTYAYTESVTTLNPQEYVEFTFETLDTFIPDSSGQVFVDFPIDYDLTFVGSLIECYEFSTGQSAKTDCSYEPNRVRISPFNDNSQGYQNFSIGVQNIENPAKQQPARYISLSYYTNEQVSLKTYSNLNRVSPFTYKKQGIEVLINDLNSFEINIGTTYDNITAKIPSGAQTSFSIKGYISEPGCNIQPNPIKFNSRDFSQYFSVSCGTQAVVGDHYINWYFLGDWPANYWSPIQRTYFTVIDSNEDLIQVNEIGIVSIGGETLPIKVVLTHSPNSYVNISLTQIGTLPTEVTISPNKLDFVRGQVEKTFRVKVGKSAIGLTGKIQVKKSGLNSEYYTLDKTLLEFDIGPKDDRYPIVVEYKDLEIGRISANFSITLDEPCNVYWMVGRYGTRSPTLSECINSHLEDSAGLMDSPIFGYIYDYTQLQQNRFQYTIQVPNLLAQTNYTIHILSVDIGGNQAVYTPKIIFNTLDRYKSAVFSLNFTKTLTPTFELKILEKVSSILNIPQNMVQKQTDFSGNIGSPPINNPEETQDYTSSSGFNRRLVQSTFQGIIIMDPSLDLKPLDLANSLSNYKDQLAELDGFDKTTKIKGQEVYGALPLLKAKPRLGTVAGGELTLVNLALFEKGNISVCIVVYNESEYNDPVPYQVNNLLDTQNYVCNISQVIEADPVPVQALFDGIEKDLEYRILISAENTLQGYPDYMWYVYVISFTTYGMADELNTGLGEILIVAGIWVLV